MEDLPAAMPMIRISCRSYCGIEAVNTATDTNQHSGELSIGLRTLRLEIAKRRTNFGSLLDQRIIFSLKQQQGGKTRQLGGYGRAMGFSKVVT